MTPETRTLIDQTIAAHEKRITENRQILELYQNGQMRSFVGSEESTRESILWIEASIASLKDGIQALRQSQADAPKEKKVPSRTQGALGGVEGRWGRSRR